ncbi:MAG TPA: SURF1 family protein [Gemmatimonadaceae bacterium]
MKKKDIVFAVLGGLFAVTCVRLGIWQLDRLSERKTFNKSLIARAEAQPIPPGQLPKDTAARRFVRVILDGAYDYGNEIRILNRTRNGSPGVNIITPVRTAGSDTALLVNRGWVYAPDGMTVDLSQWRESNTVHGEGYVENYRTGTGDPKSKSHPRAYRWLDSGVSKAFPYPVQPYFVVLIGDSGKTAPNVPPRVEVPPLDEGPHRNYAIQWFSFAAISIFGTILYLRRKNDTRVS